MFGLQMSSNGFYIFCCRQHGLVLYSVVLLRIGRL